MPKKQLHKSPKDEVSGDSEEEVDLNTLCPIEADSDKESIALKPKRYILFQEIEKKPNCKYDLHIRVESKALSKTSSNLDVLNLVLMDYESNIIRADAWDLTARSLNTTLYVGGTFKLSNWYYKPNQRPEYSRARSKLIIKFSHGATATEFNDNTFPYEMLYPTTFAAVEKLTNDDIFDLVGVILWHSDFSNNNENNKKIVIADSKGRQCIVHVDKFSREFENIHLTLKQTVVGFKGLQKISYEGKCFEAKGFVDTNVTESPICAMSDILKDWIKRTKKS